MPVHESCACAAFPAYSCDWMSETSVGCSRVSAGSAYANRSQPAAQHRRPRHRRPVPLAESASMSQPFAAFFAFAFLIVRMALVSEGIRMSFAIV
jgi:hypothetical protein